MNTFKRSSKNPRNTSFGSGGKITTDFLSNVDEAYGVAIQSDGKIVVAGRARGINPFDFALARYNSDGSLDTSFGSGGKVITDFSGLPSAAIAVALQPDNKIVAAGIANGDFALARYDGSGANFDICLQDDSSGSLLLFNSATGEYQFTNCKDFTISEVGSSIIHGSMITLQHNGSDRRVLARVDTRVNKGTATILMLSPAMATTIVDRNTGNNVCVCR